MIAVINSILTAMGVALLGLGGKMAFLTVIVFLCSFIPVLGVFISTVPICSVALQASGLTTMLLAIVMITVIHLIEGYVLNPSTVLTCASIPSSFSSSRPSGPSCSISLRLVLGVPICTYIFGHVIRRDRPKDGEPHHIEG